MAEPSPSLRGTLSGLDLTLEDPNSLLSPEFTGPPPEGAVGLPVGYSQLLRDVPTPEYEDVPAEPPTGWNLFALALGTLVGTKSGNPEQAAEVMAGLVQRPLLLRQQAQERNRQKQEAYDQTRLSIAIKGLDEAMQTQRAELSMEARAALEELKAFLRGPKTEAEIQNLLAAAGKKRTETGLLPGEAERKAADTASLIKAREDRARDRAASLRQAEERLSMKHAAVKDKKVAPFFNVISAIQTQLQIAADEGADVPSLPGPGGQELRGADAIRLAIDRLAQKYALGDQMLAAELRAEGQFAIGPILEEFIDMPPRRAR